MMAVVVVVERWLFVMLWIRKIQTRLIALRYLFPLERGWNWIRGEKRKGAYDSRPSLKDHQHKIRVLELDFGRWSCLSNVSIPRGDRQYVISELKERREGERDDTLRSVSTYNHLASYCSISLCLAHASLTPHSCQNIFSLRK